MMIHLRRNTTRRAIAAAILYTCFSPLICSWAKAQNVEVIIKAGTSVEAAGGKIVLKNTNLTTDGALDASQANIVFSGTTNSTIGGTNIPIIKILTLNKTGSGKKITLANDIKVSNHIDFQNGLIELNGKTVTLQGSATLQNENNDSRITGINGGSITAHAIAVNNPNQLNIGRLGATITSAANLGNVTITRMHQPIVNPEHADKTSIQRTFFIQPANNTALNATLRFNYLDAELDGQNENTLKLWKSNDGVTWTVTNDNTRNTTDNYVQRTGLTRLSYWTLTDAADALPVTLIYFRATCQNKYALIEWKTGSEINTGHFEVERSSDAVQWSSLQNVKALDAITGAAYSYKDLTPQPVAFYRLKVIDKSGYPSYSPVFTGGCEDIAMPFIVYPNPAKDVATARISVRENTKARIQIFNIAGQQVYASDWNLQPGTNQLPLPLTQLAAGSYAVKVLLNNAVLQTQLIKQ